MDQSFADLLPWAETQRWFPTDWKDAQWYRVYAVPLGAHTSFMLAQPWEGAALLQIPIRTDGSLVIEASTDQQFWADWLAAAGVKTPLLQVVPMGKEQSNTSVVLILEGDLRWVAKLFRVVHSGANPDVELPLALRGAGYRHTPTVHASYAVDLDGGEYTLGVATGLVENTGTAWDFFRAAAESDRPVDAEARSIGVRVGELSAALQDLPLEGAEPSISGLVARAHATLDAAAARAAFSDEFTAQVRDLIDRLGRETETLRVSRVHGDLHLGQILHTENGDWQIIDFEGEPLRPLSERVQPDFALRDLAGMLRSFSYAGWDNPDWADRSRSAFLEGFEESLPVDDRALLRLLELEKALYEVEYEAQFRPDWIGIPLASIEALLN